MAVGFERLSLVLRLLVEGFVVVVGWRRCSEADLLLGQVARINWFERVVEVQLIELEIARKYSLFVLVGRDWLEVASAEEIELIQRYQKLELVVVVQTLMNRMISFVVQAAAVGVVVAENLRTSTMRTHLSARRKLKTLAFVVAVEAESVVTMQKKGSEGATVVSLQKLIVAVAVVLAVDPKKT